MKKRVLLSLGILVIFFLEIVGCAPKRSPLSFSSGKTLAVAPIGCPSLPSEVITGYLLKGASSVPAPTLKKMDDFLVKELLSHCSLKIVSPYLVRQCEEILLRKETSSILGPISFWSRVGRCIPADYILVVQILQFRPRQGGDWGVFVPARVILTMNLIDTRKARLLSSYIFQEEQTSLMENLLQIKKFFRRRGKWVTALELAEEGIIESLKHLRLYN